MSLYSTLQSYYSRQYVARQAPITAGGSYNTLNTFFANRLRSNITQPMLIPGRVPTIEADIANFLENRQAPTRTDFGDRYLVYPPVADDIRTRAKIQVTEHTYKGGVDIINSEWGFLPYRLFIDSSATFEYRGVVDKAGFEAWLLREANALIGNDSTINITGEYLLCKILDLPAYYHRYVSELGDPFALYMDAWNSRENKVAFYTVAHPVTLATWYRTGVQFKLPEIDNYNLVISYNTVSNGDDSDAAQINLKDTRKYLVLTPESVKRARSESESDSQMNALLEASSQGINVPGSDLASIKFNFVHNVVFFFSKRKTTTRKTRRGAFMPYILDMSKPGASKYEGLCDMLQIHKTSKDLTISTSCCLEHAINVALQEQGEQSITIDRRYIEQGAVRTKYLTEIGKTIDVRIKLRRCRAVDDIRTKCNGIEIFNHDGRVDVDLLLVLDHYMYYIPDGLVMDGETKKHSTRTILVDIIDKGFIRPMTRAELDKCSPKLASEDNVFLIDRAQGDIIADCVVKDTNSFKCMTTEELGAALIAEKNNKTKETIEHAYWDRFPFNGRSYYTIYFDTETANFDNVVTPYLLYMLIYKTELIPGTTRYKYTLAYSRDIFSTTPGIYFKQHMDRLPPIDQQGKQDGVVNYHIIAHNLGFDMASLWTVFGSYDLLLGTRSRPKQITYTSRRRNDYVRKYVFSDSLNLMKMRLAEMPKRFNLKGKQMEAKLEFPYNFVDSTMAIRIANDDAVVEYSELVEFYTNTTEPSKLESTLKDLDHALAVTDSILKGSKLPANYRPRAIRGAKFVDMALFALEYCESDVYILAGAHQALMVELNSTMNIVAEKYITTASWAYAYLVQNKGVEGSVSVRGELRLYLTSSIYGGRCMTRDNKAWHLVADGKPKEGWPRVSTEEAIGWIYWDGVSLYPSAMIRMGGVPKGEPNVITTDKDLILTLLDKPFYVCTLNILDIPYAVPFSNLVRRTSKGLEYDNDFRGAIVLCKYDIDILILFGFQLGVHYEITYGVFWFEMSGRLGPVIKEVFDRRVYIKSKDALKPDGTPYTKEEKVVEALLKEQMNSSYGKPIQKFFSTKSMYKVIYNDYVDERDVHGNEEDKDDDEYSGNFRELNMIEDMSNNYGDDVKTIYTVVDGPVTRLNSEGKEYESNETHIEVTTAARAYDTKNKAHIGTAILGMARIIMAEVYWCIYQIENKDTKESGITKRYVFYGDTDSMLIDQTIIPRLKELYFEKFGRVLEGVGVGQFHSDFTPPTKDPVTGLANVVCDKELPRAIESYIIGKKFYCHLVQYKRRPYVDGQIDNNNWEWATYYHSKLKGVPKSLVSTLTLEDYERFYNGKVREFDLLEGGSKFRPVFDPKTNKMTKMTEFTREVRRLIPRAGYDEATEYVILENNDYDKMKRDKLKLRIAKLEAKME